MKSWTGFVLCLLLPLSAPAETFRCGKWIITPEVSLAELTEKCGSPTARASKVEDIKARNKYGLTVKTGETVTETWTFDRGASAAPMVVIIVDGKIKSIERLEK